MGRAILKILKSWMMIILLLSGFACDDDFLEVAPLDRFPSEIVWSDLSMVETFVNEIYYEIPHGFSNIMMASLVDESMYNADFGTSNVTKSLVTPSDYSVFDNDYWVGNRMRFMSWTYVYASIRATNLFFEKMEEYSHDDLAFRNRLIGEVHFLRAYLYHNLVAMYGGVPIIDKVYSLEEEFLISRNTLEESIDFIASECDKAAALLPLFHEGSDKGRATKGAALALKSRVLLRAASDLYHDQSWMGGYAYPKLVSYVYADRQLLWQRAQQAAKEVMDLGIYGLYRPDPASPEEAAVNFGRLFLEKETTEDIFIRYFLSTSTEEWHSYNPGLFNSPNGYHGWGSNCPSGQFVDDFQMQDGTKFDWNNPEHALAPYENREPRFYASILYDGAQWRKRPSDVINKDPDGIIQTGYWEHWDGQNLVEIPGLDTRKGPVEDWNGTHTGYYLRKFIDPSKDAQFEPQDAPWRFIRYAEILLNYAEASIELGQEAQAREAINQIRKRAGLPDLTVSGPSLKDRYRLERRIELGYEDHRYFDVRRWMITTEAYEDAEGVDIRYELQADNTTAETPTYKVITIQERDWKDRFYFLPIKLDEINRNELLIQNPLY